MAKAILEQTEDIVEALLAAIDCLAAGDENLVQPLRDLQAKLRLHQNSVDVHQELTHYEWTAGLPARVFGLVALAKMAIRNTDHIGNFKRAVHDVLGTGMPKGE